MPRGGYDCTGAAPGSFASRLGRQMYPCGGGNTPRASQAAVFPSGAMPYQPGAGAAPPHAYAAAQGQQQAVNMSMGYGYPVSGAPQQAGFMPQHHQQHHSSAYMAGHGYAALQQQPQMQAFTTQYSYAPSSMHGPATAATPGLGHHPGLVYAGAAYGARYPQQPSVYGAAPHQGPYYRHQ
ncbi:hypothetical protein CCM_06132 [Cordyceps militaris CM01]|uniref:Uncharacterized protein n=2 Tax=Cordyceps militaris TaxID=73501 RepID=G3JIX8_CORMM|nr:uncharacterized protein CCM_06132 [Cordyceps militaris CM01]ATY58783.1 hypothetical protein A9K55_003494 [Cordyceps militaris]EGX91972.1 hypothetical protein CCM_06132 [Cordyceps militaris CM01]